MVFLCYYICMKFLRNTLIITIVAIILSSISIRLAETTSGNTVYIFIIAGLAILIVSKLIINLSFWYSLKKQYGATPEELNQESINAEKYYVGEIFMFIAGCIFFINGYNDFILNGLNRVSYIYLFGSIICFALIIKRLIDKKYVIKKIINNTNEEKDNFKKDNKNVIYFVIVLVIMSFLYRFFN